MTSQFLLVNRPADGSPYPEGLTSFWGSPMLVRSFTAKSAAMSAISAIIVFTAFPSVASAQSAGTRQLMERCVDNVLARMARAKVSEAQVGPAVVSHCDGPLRAVLASAIENGQAFICTVESCIGMARQRAAEKARMAYRERLGGGL
jgi:hypothetical protein